VAHPQKDEKRNLMKIQIYSSVILLFAVSSPVVGQNSAVLEQERKDLNTVFEQAWESPLVWNLDALPTKGYVPVKRVPYAGAIYPDNNRGTYWECQKYDAAFHGGRSLASSFEDRDTREHKTSTGRRQSGYSRRGPLGRPKPRSRVPHWSGHCNGWTTAAIRHAQPTKSVERNGVVFTPADIKALLAEVYTFNENVVLGGNHEDVINAASLHVTLTNWIGRKDHPVGMERTPGKEKWNFPIYAYNMRIAKNGRHAEVHANVLYKYYLDQEQDKAPKNERQMYFHYSLSLDEAGNIIGGNYYRDSNQIEFLWLAQRPAQGGTKNNKQGNPHLDINRVLALWKASVDDDAMKNWVNVDLTPPPVAAEPADAVAATE
jgi:hypothetical protein